MDKILLPLVNAAVEFLDVLDNLLKEIFKAITTAIYEMFFLEDLDNLAKDIIVGGKANMIDFPVMISRKLENTWEKIRGSLDDLDDVLIDTIKFGLDKIGSLSYIQNAFDGGSENKNNLSAVNRALSSSESGLEALATKVREYSDRLTTLKNTITRLFEIISDQQKASEIMGDVIENIEELVKDAVTVFREFLNNVESLGSIQFLVSFEYEGVAGVVFEFGVSIDVRQLVFFIANGGWDPNQTQVASIHVGYALDGRYI